MSCIPFIPTLARQMASLLRAAWSSPDRYSMPPPELSADAPVPDVLKPHIVCPGKTLWQYPDAAVCHCLHRSLTVNLLSLHAQLIVVLCRSVSCLGCLHCCACRSESQVFCWQEATHHIALLAWQEGNRESHSICYSNAHLHAAVRRNLRC